MLPSTLPLFRDKMLADGQTESAIRSFERNYQTLLDDVPSAIPENTITPALDLPALADLPSTPGNAKRLSETVIIKLNGGLGTGMGLNGPKSLIEVRCDGTTFLDLIVRQVLHVRKTHGVPLRFLLMSSFATMDETSAYLGTHHGDIGTPEEVQFRQSRVPKIDVTTSAPATCPENPDNEWCPPGHGDLYPSLLGTGQLDALLAAGVRYAFVSNSDNLGATLDPVLLDYFAHSDLDFLMEVTQRTAADRKGGHLAIDRTTGKLLLRESAQCAASDEAAFQDIERHRYFNTNNLWLRLDRLRETLDQNGGIVPLPVIRNEKTVDPRDATSSAVYHLETAMGSAISVFHKAGAIVVDRSRFAPVKTTDDLFLLRSDAYLLTEDQRLELHPDRHKIPPSVRLDPTQYKLVDQLDRLVGNNVPSMLACDSLTVRGPVTFESGVRFEGAISIENADPSTTKTIAAGVYREERL